MTKKLDPKLRNVSETALAQLKSDISERIQPAISNGRIADLVTASNATRSILGSRNYLDALANYKDTSALASLVAFSRSMETRDNLNQEISSLRKQVAEQATQLEKQQLSGGKSEAKIEALEKAQAELRLKEDLKFLLTRVNQRAQEKLMADEAFRDIFSEDQECNAFVMSVDIRRSTELMLKARTPSMFAEFISRLTKKLFECVINNNGVFDKFTGDGVLAFFPEGFSGPDHAYSVLKAAEECHEAFDIIYRESRCSFTSVLKDIGLGIGIDYGSVRLLRVAEGLTVVGVPVVYACRLSGAHPGQTLLNQPAFEMIHESFGRHCHFEETALSIKHEGDVVAYSAKLSRQKFSPREPDWALEDTVAIENQPE